MYKFAIATFLYATQTLFPINMANSADIRAISYGDTNFITIIGRIEIGDGPKFVEAALKFERAIVLFESDGGALNGGIDIGKAIRLKNFETHVLDKTTCASACALAWLGGTKRSMSSTAKVGFHAAYRMENGVARETGLGNAIVGAYLNSLGFSQKTVEFVTRPSPDLMEWLTFSNAEIHGIVVSKLDTNVNSIITAQQVSTPSSGYETPKKASATPQFRNFPALTFHQGPNAQVNLSGAAWNYRTRILAASRIPPNFAGRYIVTTWGCGTTCQTGAVIDAVSGQATLLPFTICCATPSEGSFQPIEFRRHSRLMIFAGLRNETGLMGAHFYEFNGTSFQFIKTVEDNGTFAAAR